MSDETQENMIEAFSACSAAGNPFVELRWQDKGAHITPGNARELVNNLLQAAVSAEADAMLLRFFRSRDLPDCAWQAMMTLWREWREKQT